jgi:hypothetical protein
MTEPFHEPVAPSDYGRQRRAAWLAGLQANSDMATSAAMQAHAQSDDRRVTQSGQAGLFGHMTPEDRGAAVQDRAATVGTDWGNGRPLERQGGTFDPAAYGSSPAPARVDLTGVNASPGFLRTEHPLKHRNQGG